MAEASASVKKPLQQGVEDSLLDHYYDIMVIGKTGSGKSTTVDKLLIASLPGQQRQQGRSQQQGSSEQPSTEGEEAVVQDHGKRSLRLSNMVMWLVSDKNFDFQKVCLRIKNLVFYSSLEDPHKEVNAARMADMHVYESTTHCELFSNELTRIRVLDVPGFFGPNAAKRACDLDSRVIEVMKTDLSIMRKILRIKNTHNFGFNRIVYFLPEKGSLKRASQDLIIELGIMKQYFDRPIFESMVVVATLSSDAYEHIIDDRRDLFPQGKVEDTRRYLREALQIVFESQDIPNPPIIFISLFDSCETILEKIQRAEVKQDSLNLEFQSNVCARCNVTIVREGLGEAEVPSCTSPNQLGAMLLDESKCHPMMVPKYSMVKRILGGIVHLITLRQFVGKWPSFESMDEECANCQQPPKTGGCMRVGDKFLDKITVEHSASAVESYQIEVRDDEEEKEEKDADPSYRENGQTGRGSPAPGTPQGAGFEHRGNYYVYQDGREVYRQEQGLYSSPNMDLKG